MLTETAPDVQYRPPPSVRWAELPRGRPPAAYLEAARDPERFRASGLPHGPGCWTGAYGTACDHCRGGLLHAADVLRQQDQERARLRDDPDRIAATEDARARLADADVLAGIADALNMEPRAVVVALRRLTLAPDEDLDDVVSRAERSCRSRREPAW